MTIRTKTWPTLVLFLLTLLWSGQVMAQLYRNIPLSPEDQNRVLGVRLYDVGKHTNIIPNFADDAEDLQRKWDWFVDKEYELEDVLNLFLHDYPKRGPRGYLFPVTAFGELERGGQYAFIQANAYYDDGDWDVQVINVLPLDQTMFSLKVSLADRKLVMTDDFGDLKMVFPLGVGSFDENVLNDGVTLLTPRFENSFIDKWMAISERKKPRYFAGKPFIRITTTENPKHGHTAIGFHAQPNLDDFIRAFDSHGCMRMQLDDLQTLHDLLKKGPHRRLSIDVKFRINDPSDHPFPRINRPYKKVLNTGSERNPNYKLDRDGLVQTTKDWENFAPMHLLKDRSGDHHHEMFDYEMSWREQEKKEEKREKCYAKYPYGEVEDDNKRDELLEEFEDCMEKGRRGLTLRDRIYRWWVH